MGEYAGGTFEPNPHHATMMLVQEDEVVLNVAEVLDALVCLHYLGRLDNKRCWRCKPCALAAQIDGSECATPEP